MPTCRAITAIAGKLQQVVLNLLLNAKDAMHGPPNARIRIAHGTDAKARVGCHRRTPASGIEPEHMHRIYDPFFTTKTSRKQGQRGTGLGLAVSYGIMQEHAGKMHVESKLASGTTFHLGVSVAEENRVTCLKATSQRRWTAPPASNGFGCPAAAHSDHRRRSRDPRVARDAADSGRLLRRPWRATAQPGLSRSPNELSIWFCSIWLCRAQRHRDSRRAFASSQPQLPVIMITAFGTVDNVVDAIRAGAQNFVQKPWDNEKLLADIRAAIGRHRAEEEIVQLKRALKQRYNFENIVGKSEPMLRIFDLVAQVAPSRSTVLIQGESGTGKELIAKALHANSPRKDKPFVPVNTGAMPTDLLESTLFGHVKGAFTSAIAAKKGLFEVANGGTLFLDEIAHHGDRHAGQDSARAAGPAVHASGRRPGNSGGRTHHRRHQRRSAHGRAREPLPGRSLLSPQRDRDRAAAAALAPRRYSALATHFLKHYSEENGLSIRALTPEAIRALVDYDWPGNVRELENVIERGVVLSSGGTIGVDLLPGHITGSIIHRACSSTVRMPRCSTSWKTSSGGSSWTSWSAATAIRPRRRSSFGFRSRR